MKKFVIVLEIIGGMPSKPSLFPDTLDGNKKAEEHFRSCILENDDDGELTDLDIDEAVVNEIYSNVEGYEIHILRGECE